MSETKAKIQIAIEKTEKLLAALKGFENSGLAEHRSLLRQTDQLRMSLEEPNDVISRLLQNISIAGALNTLINLGSIQELPTDGTSIKTKDLADLAKVDTSVTTRLFRLLACSNITQEIAPNEYVHNDVSRSMQIERLGALFLLGFDMFKATTALPEYLKTHTAGDICDIRKSPLVWIAGKEGMRYYEMLDLDPERRHVFNLAMPLLDRSFPVLGMFPFDSLRREEAGIDGERALIVDIAGGRGQSLLSFQKEYPGTFEERRLILQDLPVVLDTLEVDKLPGIELMAYDMFTPQPVKNAQVYFIRRILHDYYTLVCIEILKNTVQAMGSDSRLIICDVLLPERIEFASATDYVLDVSLMMMSGTMKTLEEFNGIFDVVGLELVKVYPAKIGGTVMLETRLKGKF